MLKSGWIHVFWVASVIGVVALVSNITTETQLTGQADTWLTVRFTLSKLVNAGTVWGGLLILAGWLVRRPLAAALAGIAAGEVALAVHYALGQVFAVYGYGAHMWAANWPWFVIALVLGAPLGLLGATARRRDGWGLAARLVVPVGAIVEPFVTSKFARVGP
ncbi:MAG: hypothetical protein Q4F67_17660, partial [Propionibacteriaceae bacterium]|nr:hypothetical protein [Propionibacteriaceae bacterium]